jgi:hypothetical protein
MSARVLPGPDYRTLDLFLCQITGSESAPQSGPYRTVGLSGLASDSPTASETATGLPMVLGASGYVHSPTVRSGTSPNTQTLVAELRILLAEMAGDIDAVAFQGGIEVPYIGWNIRRHYGRVIRNYGLAAATADAERRYWMQAECAAVEQLPDLTYPVKRGAA